MADSIRAAEMVLEHEAPKAQPIDARQLVVLLGAKREEQLRRNLSDGKERCFPLTRKTHRHAQGLEKRPTLAGLARSSD